MSLNSVLFQFHKKGDYRFIKDIFNTFGLTYHNYKSVKYDIDITNFISYQKEKDKFLFEHIPAEAFYYDVAMDIISRDDFNEKISKVAANYVKENYSFDTNVGKSISLEDSIYVLANINNIEVMKTLAYTRILDIKTLSEEIMSELNLENDKMIAKYIQRQKEKIYLYIFNSDGFDERSIYNVIANLVKQADSDCVASLFGYVFYEDDLEYISNNIDAIKNITETEIKRFLLFKIGEAEFNDNPLTKSTMIRFGGLEEIDIQAFIYRIRQSCEEYFLLKEIADVQRKQVIEEIFEKKASVQVQADSSKAIDSVIKEKEDLQSENALLSHRINTLTNEVESLRKSLDSKDKEFDSDFRNIKEEYDKKFARQKLLLEGMTKQNIGFALLTQVLSAYEDEEDLIYPYKLDEIQRKKILVLGGRDETRRELSKILPKAVFIDTETRKEPTTDFDCLFIFNMFLNHSLFFKYIKIARKNNIPVGYTPSTNMDRILSDIYLTVRRVKELNVPKEIIED